MMRPLPALLTLALLGCGIAFAQTPQANFNYIVPTAPDGTSNNQAASTAFASRAASLATNNRAVNPVHAISQENGTNAVVVGTNALTYISDGNEVYTGGAGVTAQIVSDGPPGITYSMKLMLTSAAVSPDDNVLTERHVEGYDVADFALGTASARTITIGEWLKTNVAGTYPYFIQNNIANRSYVHEVTLPANVWTFVTFTLPGDTTGTWDKANLRGITAGIALKVGNTVVGVADVWQDGNKVGPSGDTNWAASLTGGSGGAAPTFQATGLIILPDARSLSAASSILAIPPAGVTMAKVLRYYNKTYDVATAPGTVTHNGELNAHGTGTSGSPYINYRYPVPMRPFGATGPGGSTVTNGPGNGSQEGRKYYSPGTGTVGKVRDLNSSADYDAGEFQAGEKGLTVGNGASGSTITLGDYVSVHVVARSQL